MRSSDSPILLICKGQRGDERVQFLLFQSWFGVGSGRMTLGTGERWDTLGRVLEDMGVGLVEGLWDRLKARGVAGHRSIMLDCSDRTRAFVPASCQTRGIGGRKAPMVEGILHNPVAWGLIVLRSKEGEKKASEVVRRHEHGCQSVTGRRMLAISDHPISEGELELTAGRGGDYLVGWGSSEVIGFFRPPAPSHRPLEL